MKRFILAFKRSIEQLLQKVFFNKESVSVPTVETEVSVYVDPDNNNALTGLNSNNEEIVLVEGTEHAL